MKHVAVILVTAVAALAAATSAGAGTAKGARTRSDVGQLKAQVVALRRDVAKLQSQVKKLRKDLNNTSNELDANFVADACLSAITGDTFVTTWRLTDQLAQETKATILFGPQTVLDDKGACDALIPPVKRNNATPTLAVYQALLEWLV